MRIFLAGPIDYWWNENWQTPAHIAYMQWRTEVLQKLVEAGHLVYCPHQAFKGAWQEIAQNVNDEALKICQIFINLCPDAVPAYGTIGEQAQAEKLGKQIRYAPPGYWDQIEDLIIPLDDPYGDVNRKSYTK